MKQVLYRWAVVFRSSNRLGGDRADFVFSNCQPVLFNTRREARAYRDEALGYIKHRPDLQAEPHGWKPARVVKVAVTIVTKQWGTT